MKKKHVILIAGSILILSYSCSLEIPGSVTIKGSPVVVIPGGNRSQQLNAIWDIEAQLDEIASGIEELTVVQTQPGQLYKLEYNKEIVNIAISDFASDILNFQDINQTIDPQIIEIPSLTLDPQSISENIDPISVPENVDLQTFSLTNIPELYGTIPLSGYIDSDGYSNITFDSGTLEANITITEDEVTSGLIINLLSVEILETDDTLICATNSSLPVNLVTSPTITFPLSGETFPSTFKIQLTLDIANGGGFPQTFNLDASFDFTPDTTISAAIGVDIDETLNSSTIIPFDPGTEFVSTIIGAGQIDISLDFPPTWTNITSSIDITLFQNAVPVTSGIGAIPYTLDLNGINLSSGDLSIQYEVSVTGADASFDLDPSQDEISGSIESSITNLDTLVITPDADIDFSRAIAESIDESTLDLVENATFLNPVITTTITNNLPFNIDVSLNSPELELDPGTANHSFPSTGMEEAWNQPFLMSSGNVLDMSSAFITGDNEVNLDLEVSIPGYNKLDNELTLNNIIPGTIYTLSGNVVADLTLSYLVIRSNTFSAVSPDTSSGEDPMDFSQLTDLLPDTIDFVGIESLLDISLDSSAGDLSIYLAAHYTDPETSLPTIDDLLGTSSTPLLVNTSKVISIDNLQNVLNKRPSDLTFSYEITMAGTTINVTGSEDKISANLNLDIPFIIYSNGDSELLDEDDNPIFTATEDDLFGRSEVDENDVMNNIESVIFHIDIENNTGIDSRIDIEETDFNFSVSSATGSKKIELGKDHINAIINNVPFNPVMHLIIPEGTHSIYTDPTFEISAWFEIKTKINYTIDFTGGENESFIKIKTK